MKTTKSTPVNLNRVTVLTAVAAACLYTLVVMIAEPMQALGATTDTETAVVQLTLGASIGLNCDADGGGAGSGETLSLTGFSDSGDTGPLNGSVTVGLNPFRYAAGSDSYTTPTAWNSTNVPSTVAAWGGRIAQSSSGHAVSPVTWGNDAATDEKWMAVSTGATTTIASENNASQEAGSNNRIGFRVEVGGDKIQPTGTYRATVTFTASTK
ncbi:MAG: hypothetical protein UY90_C0007G0025 [Candidatus Peregrinibacteria bacterium GW2011_GWA2_54_9]|nr:MAG: hypothetical protein UY90_C0007G0025 [Candidatus Peregrinibacteria bacterium GW2011_GWA2_54_9]